MKQVVLTIAVTLVILGGAVPAKAQHGRPVAPPPPRVPSRPGDPVPGLNTTQRAAFDQGRMEFTELETITDGLGPVFNGRSCAECHAVPAVGGTSGRNVTRIGAVRNGTYDPLVTLGGSLLQSQGIGPREGSTHRFNGEIVPRQATIAVQRRTTSLLGLGFIDATPDATFIALAADQRSRDAATAGHAARVDNLAAGGTSVGKFGWKAQVPTLFQFAADAYLNEMGITNPLFPSENCPQGNCAELAFNPAPGINDIGDGVRALADFMLMLDVPPRGPVTQDVNAGEQLFNRIGCASCHTGTLQTGRSEIAALDRATYHPYSDFLLHDMGSLGDGIVQADAAATELRTAPLWGLRFTQRFLHDGRSATLEDAIERHDGQARASRDRFRESSPADRAKLVAFLRSL